MLPGLSTPPDPARARRAAEIGALVRARLATEEDAAVTVQQLTCREPGCPPIETVIAVLGSQAPRRWTIHRPLVEVDDTLVEFLLDTHPDGDQP